jgi:acyl-CoA thioesterase
LTSPDERELAFLGMAPAGAGRWTIGLESHHMNPVGTLYGGTGVAAAALALEVRTGQPLRWLTTRFLGTARAGDRLDLETAVDVAGSRTSQVSARARLGDEVVLDVVGATGEGHPEGTTAQWSTFPDAPPPEDLDPVPPLVEVAGTFLDTLERRLAYGAFPTPGATPGPARVGLWTRVAGHDSTTAAMLGWLADCMPVAVAAALGRMPYATSLDNTVRLAARPGPTEWILADVRATASERGYAYGDVDLWSREGVLLATGSQTAAVKSLPLPGAPSAG